MKKPLLFLLLFISSGATHCVLAQGGTVQDYYDYQRKLANERYQKQQRESFNYKPPLTFDYTVDQEEVLSILGVKKGPTAEQERARRAQDLADYMAKKRQEAASAAARLNAYGARVAESDAIAYAPKLAYMDVGFKDYEADALSYRTARYIGNNPSDVANLKLRYERDPEGMLAAKSFRAYKDSKDTAGFDVLFGYIHDFRFAPVTALEALSHLERRFPHKRDIIEFARPKIGIYFWTNGGILPNQFRTQNITPYARSHYFYVYKKKDRSAWTAFEQEMHQHFVEWYNRNPIPFLVSMFAPEDCFENKIQCMLGADIPAQMQKMLVSLDGVEMGKALKKLAMECVEIEKYGKKGGGHVLFSTSISGLLDGQDPTTYDVNGNWNEPTTREDEKYTRRMQKERAEKEMQSRKTFYSLLSWEDVQAMKSAFNLDDHALGQLLLAWEVPFKDKAGVTHLIYTLKKNN